MSVSVPPPPQPTKPPASPRRRWWLRGGIALAALAVLGLVASLVYGGAASSSLTSHVTRQPLLPPDQGSAPLPSTPGAPRTTRPPATSSEARNYVLIASENTDATDAGERNDSIMVLHVAADSQSAHLISFPQDLWVTIPGYGSNTLDAAYAMGGWQATVEALEQLLDLRMDHVALVDLDGFISLTEEVGGVTVDNKRAFSARGFDFPVGTIPLQGDQARAFAEARDNRPNAEEDRTSRQRQVIRAIVAKGLSNDTIRNPAEFTRFLAGVSRQLTVDEQLDDAELRRIALLVRPVADDIRLVPVPTSGFSQVKGASVDVLDPTRLAELRRALKDDAVGDYASKYPRR